MAAFLNWHSRYFDGIRTAPSNSTCGPVELLEINGHRLGILPINSALFCEGDDHEKLWIGRRCLDTAVEDLRKLNGDLNIALVHHPLDSLSASEPRTSTPYRQHTANLGFQPSEEQLS